MDTPIDVTSQNEIGQLLMSFDNMRHHVHSRQQRLETIFDTAAEGIITFDIHGNIESFNQASQKLFGYMQEEIVGKDLGMLIVPSDKRERHEGYLAYFLCNKLKDFIGQEGEVMGQHKDGTTFSMALKVSSMMLQGRQLYTALLSDITERKQAEEALRRSEVSLAEAQRIAHLGNWEWDILNNELRWSDEVYRIFGLTPREFGATYEAFLCSVHPDDREFVEKSVDKALYRKKPYSIDHRILLPDGKSKEMSILVGNKTFHLSNGHDF